VLAAQLGLESGFWSWLNALDFGTVGYAVAALFILTWVLSVGIWKLRRIEERWGGMLERA